MAQGKAKSRELRRLLLFNRHQTSLANRVAFIIYDMLGMGYWYPDQHVQSPSDENNARAIARLIAAGYFDRLLRSQDVFLKMMPSHYGGSNAYVLRDLLLRLKRHGVSHATISVMLIDNPRKVFPLTDSRLGDECDDGPLEIEVAIQAHRVSVHLPVFNAFTVFFAFPGFDPTFPLPSEVGKWQASLKHLQHPLAGVYGSLVNNNMAFVTLKSFDGP